MSTRHEWEIRDDGVQERVWVCTQCGAATNNAFLASLPRECPGKPKEEEKTQA